MASIAAAGWDTLDTCDPATSVIVEPARSAMLRCVAGGMTRARDGQPPVRLGEVLRGGLVDGRWLEERLGVTFRSSRVTDDVENGVRVWDVERGDRATEDLEGGLADLGDERVDVYERLDVTAGGAGVRDHHAPL
jgi:hypothetical protein